MINKIKNKEAKIAVIGLGYVGLPIALEFARKAKVSVNAETENARLVNNFISSIGDFARNSQKINAASVKNPPIKLVATTVSVQPADGASVIP